MSMPAASAKTTKLATSLIGGYALLDWRAMLIEVNLLPKPGLMDRINCGMHKDTTLEGFRRSVLVTQGWLPCFIGFSVRSAEMAPEEVSHGSRPIGMTCEGDVFRAIAGVNTHKDSTFSLRLLCAAIDRSLQLSQSVTPIIIRATAANFCHGLTDRELRIDSSQLATGQWLCQQLGLTGVHGEARTGYPLVINHTLPHYLTLLNQRLNPELALLDILLLSMAINGDTNVTSRDSEGNLHWLQREAQILLSSGGI